MLIQQPANKWKMEMIESTFYYYYYYRKLKGKWRHLTSFLLSYLLSISKWTCDSALSNNNLRLTEVHTHTTNISWLFYLTTIFCGVRQGKNNFIAKQVTKLTVISLNRNFQICKSYNLALYFTALYGPLHVKVNKKK